MVAFSMLQLEARRECVAEASEVWAKLTGEQRRLGLPVLSSEKDNADENVKTSGLV